MSYNCSTTSFGNRSDNCSGNSSDNCSGNCFRCHQPGHWASKCPTLLNSAGNISKSSGHCSASSFGNRFDMCFFCGHSGHWASNCEMKKALLIPVPAPSPAQLPEEPISGKRIRSHAALMSLSDIMFNTHLNMGFTKEMEEQVVALMKSVGGRDMDEGRIAEYVFEENRESFMIGDEGHMRVLGFIIKRYISASNDTLKAFLRDMHQEMPDTFDSIAKGVFGLIVVRKANGTMCFRKPTGQGI